MKKFYLLLSLFILYIGINLSAQEAASKVPPGFQFENRLISTSQIYKAVLTQDVRELRTQDMEHIKDGHPLRIAVGISMELDLNNTTTQWLSLPTGEKIWQYAVRAEEAEGIIIFFDELYIPEDGELFVYTENREQLQVFTHDTNPQGGAYSSTALYQEEIILEYIQYDPAGEEARIKISDIGYIYRTKSALEDDLSCFINVNCEEALDWQPQKNGVVGLTISIPEGRSREWYICSGSLVNNMRQDLTPYILTANHCIEGYDQQTFTTIQVDFFKESAASDCFIQSYTSSQTKTLTGAALVADVPLNGASDGTLLKLTQDIPASWEVYYNGWDARGIAATSGVSVHHPNGMVKKISTFNRTLQSDGRLYMGNGEYTAANSHWRVYWAETTNGQSVTAGGSSGSPVFNQNGLIVGTLTGGESYCDDAGKADWYGKFSYHWDQYSDSKQHFKNYLDPDNTGTLVLNGYDPHAVNFTAAPVATAATNVSQSTFTANWNALDNATKYFLDVYSKENDSEVRYVEGYRLKNVGNVTSFPVSGLADGVNYYYVVRAGAGSVLSAYSNEVGVATVASSTVTPSSGPMFVRVDKDNIIITCSIPGSSLSMYEVSGKHLLSKTLNKGEFILPKSHFPPGLYLLKINEETIKIHIE